MAACSSAIKPSSKRITTQEGATPEAPAIDTAAPTVEIDALGAFAAKPGEVVEVSGKNLGDGMTASIDGTVVGLTVSSRTRASFVVPEGGRIGSVIVVVMADDQPVKTLSLVVDSAGDDLPIMLVAPGLVCKGISFRDAKLEVQRGLRNCADSALLDCAADGATDCRATASFRAANVAGFTDADVRSGVTIAGVAGGLTGAPVACAADGATGCLANNSFKALSPASIDAARMLQSQSLLGVTGSVLTCSSDGASGCYVPSYVATTQPYKAIDYDNVNANKAKFRTSLTIAGAGGTLADCGGNGATGCVTTPTYKSADLTNLAAGNVKDGVTIAGQLGDYPSSTHPLTVSDGVADLDTPTFDVKIKSASDFGWFDRDGHRYTHAGDSAIDEVNIVDGVSIFGVDGIAAPAPDAWDVRVGKTVNGVSGKLQSNCRNLASTVFYDQGPLRAVTINTGNSTLSAVGGIDPFNDADPVRVTYDSIPLGVSGTSLYYVRDVNTTAHTFALESSVGGGAITITSAGSNVFVYRMQEGTLDAWDTIDDLNMGFSIPAQNPWSVENACGGVDDGLPANAGNIWKDVTELPTPGCDNTKDCRFMDKISGLEWAEVASSTMPWGSAVTYCDGLTFDGKSDWRLPTQKELLSAYVHGIRSAANADWIPLTTFAYSFWSSSTHSTFYQQAWAILFAVGSAGSWDKSFVAHYVSCVR
jgi:hypothetical protein